MTDNATNSTTEAGVTQSAEDKALATLNAQIEWLEHGKLDSHVPMMAVADMKVLARMAAQYRQPSATNAPKAGSLVGDAERYQWRMKLVDAIREHGKTVYGEAWKSDQARSEFVRKKLDNVIDAALPGTVEPRFSVAAIRAGRKEVPRSTSPAHTTDPLEAA